MFISSCCSSYIISDSGHEPTLPVNMNLCYLKMNEHLLLCSSVYDALLPSEYGLSIHVNKLNYVLIHRRIRCHNKFARITSDKYFASKAVPCAFGERENYSKPQFYILPDLDEQTSVFVLTKDKDDAEEINLVAKVVNVHVLFEIDHRKRTRPISRKSHSRRERKKGRRDIHN